MLSRFRSERDKIRAVFTHVLELEHRALEEIPPEVYEHIELEYLSVWKNQLTAISPSIAELSALEVLILADNHLSEVPAELAKLTKLHTLDLGHNRLEHVPESLGDLQRYLYLHDNKLRSIPCLLYTSDAADE